MEKKLFIADNVSGVEHCSLVNGIGLRTVVWFQGCSHHCCGCHNPDSWDVSKGFPISVDSLLTLAKPNCMEDGITLSGGDPFDQPNLDLVVEFLQKYKKENPDKTVIVYTGYTFEQLIQPNENRAKLLGLVDWVIDGPFNANLKSDKVSWRGSSNQRIIDVSKYIANGFIVSMSDF